MHDGPAPEQWQEKVHTTADMHVVIDRILSQMTAAGFSDKDLFSMRLALEEAIVNAIKHGNAGDPRKSVRVKFSITTQNAVVEVEDQGPGFNPNKIPDPLAPENLESPSGRGLFLIRYYMSWVKFNDCGNCMIIGKEKSTH